MRYKAFAIENFKGIENLTIDLSRQPTTNVLTLVGLNESGKTTILEALAWYSGAIEHAPHDLIPKGHRANFNGDIRVRADIELSAEDQKAVIEFLARRQFRVESIPRVISVTKSITYTHSKKISHGNLWSLSPYGKATRAKSAKSLTHKDAMWRDLIKHVQRELFPPIIYYENLLFDFPDEIYLTPLDDEWREVDQKRYRDVLQDVLTSLGIGLTIDRHLVSRFKSGRSSEMDSMQAVLDQASARITEVVVSAWREIVKQPVKDLSITLGNVQSDERGVFLRLKVKEGYQTYDIRERSLGFRWFLGFILFTHFRTFRDNQRRDALFLLDEPASNLHPAAQMKVLSLFEHIPKNQMVMYSTHSHYMVRPEWLSGTYVVYNTGREYDSFDLRFSASMTNIRAERYFNFVATHPNESDLYRPVLDALDFRPSPLEKVPEIVIVEGKNDYYTLLFMSKLLGGSSLDYLHVYPSAGKDKIADIVALYLAWGRKYVVLLDGDKGGRETATRLRKAYGAVVQNKVFTLEDVDPNWRDRVLEDLFSAEECLTIQQHAFPNSKEYSKSSFNTALQSIYLEGATVKISSATRNKFRLVLDFLREKMQQVGALSE